MNSAPRNHPSTQATHTPLPWRWEFVGTAGQWMLLGAGDAFVEVGGPPDTALSPDKVLIAAAPELLEALAFCRSVIEANGVVEMSERMALEKADGAVAKARGEA